MSKQYTYEERTKYLVYTGSVYKTEQFDTLEKAQEYLSLALTSYNLPESHITQRTCWYPVSAPVQTKYNVQSRGIDQMNWVNHKGWFKSKAETVELLNNANLSEKTQYRIVCTTILSNGSEKVTYDYDLK